MTEKGRNKFLGKRIVFDWYYIIASSGLSKTYPSPFPHFSCICVEYMNMFAVACKVYPKHISNSIYSVKYDSRKKITEICM